MAFVVFWPYAAYYFVSRWDDMKPQLAAVLTGLVLLTAGEKTLEYAHWRGGDGSTEPRPPGLRNPAEGRETDPETAVLW
ncbi:MAG: hypothetical protein U0835_19000 [Isosphaeraceae bacterium]